MSASASTSNSASPATSASTSTSTSTSTPPASSELMSASVPMSVSVSVAASASVSRACSAAVLAKLPAQWHPDSTVPTLYWFPFSQPSRAVAQLLEEGSVEHKKVVIDILGKQEQKDPLYMEYINPAGQVPVLFKPSERQWMNESNDIMRYLVSVSPALASWYPFDSASSRALIDSRLKFVSERIRPIATGMLHDVLVRKDKKAVKAKLEALPALVAELEALFSSESDGRSGGQSIYLANTSEPSLADLQLFHELAITKDLGLFPWQEKKAPKLTRWYKAMKNRKATKKTYAVVAGKVKVIAAILAIRRIFGKITM